MDRILEFLKTIGLLEVIIPLWIQGVMNSLADMRVGALIDWRTFSWHDR